MSFRFMNFRVYLEAKKLYRITIYSTKNFSSDYYYLKDQLRRAALSIILNIAEGSAKGSDKDFNRYIGNSLGSVNELAAGFDVAFDEGLITLKTKELLFPKIEDVKNQLGSFSKKLKVGS